LKTLLSEMIAVAIRDTRSGLKPLLQRTILL